MFAKIRPYRQCNLINVKYVAKHIIYSARSRMYKDFNTHLINFPLSETLYIYREIIENT